MELQKYNLINQKVFFPAASKVGLKFSGLSTTTAPSRKINELPQKANNKNLKYK